MCCDRDCCYCECVVIVFVVVVVVRALLKKVTLLSRNQAFSLLLMTGDFRTTM